MFISLTLIALAALIWLVWEWRSGALVKDCRVAKSYPIEDRRVTPALSSPAAHRVDSRLVPVTRRAATAPPSPLPVPQRQGLVLRTSNRDAA